MRTLTTVDTTERIYNAKELMEMLGISYKAFAHCVIRHPQFEKYHVSKHKYAFTIESIIEFANTLASYGDKRIQRNINRAYVTDANSKSTSIDSTEPITAEVTTIYNPNNDNYSLGSLTSDDVVSITELKQFIEFEEQKGKKYNKFLKLKEQFDGFTTTDLQSLFNPLFIRFKFSYISHETGVQSQTLTCIKQGNLKGLEQYKLLFSAFLSLIHFALNNHVELSFDKFGLVDAY